MGTAVGDSVSAGGDRHPFGAESVRFYLLWTLIEVGDLGAAHSGWNLRRNGRSPTRGGLVKVAWSGVTVIGG